MFDPNTAMIGGAVIALFVAAWQANKLDKRNKVLETRVNVARQRQRSATTECAKARDRFAAEAEARQRLNGRINDAIKLGLKQPHMRPGKIIDILMGLEDDMYSPLGEFDLAQNSIVDMDGRRFLIENPEDVMQANDPKTMKEILDTMPPMTERSGPDLSLYQKLMRDVVNHQGKDIKLTCDAAAAQDTTSIKIMHPDGTTEHVPISSKPGDHELIKVDFAEIERRITAAELSACDHIDAYFEDNPPRREDLLKSKIFIKFAAMNSESIEEYVDNHFPNALRDHERVEVQWPPEVMAQAIIAQAKAGTPLEINKLPPLATDKPYTQRSAAALQDRYLEHMAKALPAFAKGIADTLRPNPVKAEAWAKMRERLKAGAVELPKLGAIDPLTGEQDIPEADKRFSIVRHARKVAEAKEASPPIVNPFAAVYRALTGRK